MIAQNHTIGDLKIWLRSDPNLKVEIQNPDRESKYESREIGSRDLDTIDGEETAEDALLETGSENNDLVLFIHGSIPKVSYRERDQMNREKEELGDRRGRWVTRRSNLIRK